MQRDRPTEIIEVNDSSAILHMIEERMRRFEQRFTKKSGFLLRLLCAAVFAFYCIASEIYIPKLPTIEVLFVAFLIAFLFNYYLIRDGHILPYIESEDENYQAKVAGVAGFASIILFIYSYQHCEITTSLFTFALAWVVYLLVERCSKQIRTQLNKRQILFGLGMILMTGLILQPNFSPEIDTPALAETIPASDETQQPAEQTEATTNTPAIDVDSHMYGVLAAVMAGLLFGYMNLSIRSLKNANFITLTHIFTYIQAPFIPVFFPLQKLVSPSLAQWAFMIGLGMAFVFILQLYIRSIQLENPSKTLLAIPQFVAFVTLFSLLFGVSIFGEPSVAKAVGAVVILGLSYSFVREIGSEIPRAGQNNNNSYLPETSNQKDIPLQTFSKKDNLSLSQKLLDSQQ